MNLKSICIVGVDGTGKSSLIQMLAQTIGETKAIVQYMGLKDWESGFGKKYLSKKGGGGILSSFMKVIAIFVEMYHRVYKYRGSDKVIIFDRYVDERIISREMSKKSGKSDMLNKIYKLFFLHYFHRPILTFYLECPIDYSIKRKDDITTDADIDNLKKSKAAYDQYYKGKADVIIINTSENNQQQTLQIVLSECKKVGLC